LVRKCVTVLTLTGSLAFGGSGRRGGARVHRHDAGRLAVGARRLHGEQRPGEDLKVREHVSGAGGFFCCTTVASGTLKLQRWRCNGWQTLDSASVTCYRGAWYWWVSWNCAGSGTYTYRTTIIATTNGDDTFVRESNCPRWSC